MFEVSKKRGFTLIETIVASTILCGSVLTIGAICSRAVTGTKLNRSNELAMTLINRQLSLIDYVGIDEFLNLNESGGEFEDYAPGYFWTVTTQYQDLDALYYLSLTVYWYEHTRRHEITVDTMLDGASDYVSSSSTTGTGS
jgi:prepilin-type N-terminal cleavage/methylation domain-containing protein